MKSNLLSVIAICLLFVNVGYAQENPFEGSIRMAFSGNLDNITRMTNSLLKDYKDHRGGLNEVLAGGNADFEYLIKVKDNKYVQFNTSDGSLMLVDCEKGDIFLTYPVAKMALKYTVDEYKDLLVGKVPGSPASVQVDLEIKIEVNILQDSLLQIAGYQCKKAISLNKMKGQVVGSSEYWFTDEIVFPTCYLELLKRPGLAMLEKTTLMNNTMYSLVTEVEETEISDDNFVLPKDYAIFTPKDYAKFSKKLNDAAKKKKTYSVGSKIPETFWDF
jgi:hypothetical protein